MTEETIIVCNGSTGEIVAHISGNYEYGDQLKFTKRASIDKLRSQCDWGDNWKFVKLFSDNVRALEGKLSAGSMMIMFALAPCISPRSNLVINASGNEMNNENIQEATGLSKKVVAKYMNELVDSQVLFRGRTGHSYKYFANPYIYCKGNVINDTLEEMFKGYPTRLKSKAMLINGTAMITWGEDWSFTKLFTEYFRVADGKISSGSVAVMFAIAPYVAYGSNVLCKRGRITEHLNNTDIQKITGVSKNSIAKYIGELLDNKILARDDNGRYVANPYVYCKGGKVDKALVLMFKDYEGQNVPLLPQNRGHI